MLKRVEDSTLTAVEESFDRGLQRRQRFRDGATDYLRDDSVVLMSNDVSHASYLCPRNLRLAGKQLKGKCSYGFADDEELKANGVVGDPR